MLESEAFVEAAKRRNFTLWTGVPCSFLQPFINYVISDESIRYVAAANEGDAVAIAAGAELGGGRGVAMFQNSGLGNAVNPLTSLALPHRIAVLLIVTLRGDPNGAPDEPQHQVMGAITTRLLDLMQIPWEYFPAEASQVDPSLDRATDAMESGTPFCFVLRSGTVAPFAAPPAPKQKSSPPFEKDWTNGVVITTRERMLAAVQASVRPDDVVLATTGYTGRELYALGDRANQFYLVGAMGCVSSLGLGLALQRPDLRIIVLDGDGAALMRLGALSSIAQRRPSNLVHILLDNGLYESTGGQATGSQGVDFCAIARGAGYEDCSVVSDPNVLSAVLSEGDRRLRFIRTMILPGVMPNLPRPKIGPGETARRLRAHIQSMEKHA